MSEESFLVAVKSTVDFIASNFATANNLLFVDLDDVTATEDLFKTQSSAVLFRMNTLAPSPIDPLYLGTLQVGVRTVKDPANYELLTAVGAVGAMFPRGERIVVANYSGSTVGSDEGVMSPYESSVAEQQYDLLSGIRMVNVHFHAQRTV